MRVGLRWRLSLRQALWDGPQRQLQPRLPVHTRPYHSLRSGGDPTVRYIRHMTQLLRACGSSPPMRRTGATTQRRGSELRRTPLP